MRHDGIVEAGVRQGATVRVLVVATTVLQVAVGTGAHAGEALPI